MNQGAQAPYFFNQSEFVTHRRGHMKESKKIAQVIEQAFIPCDQVAASRLYKMGVTETRMMELRKELAVIPDPWFVNTCNALRDIERGFRKPVE